MKHSAFTSKTPKILSTVLVDWRTCILASVPNPNATTDITLASSTVYTSKHNRKSNSKISRHVKTTHASHSLIPKPTTPQQIRPSDLVLFRVCRNLKEEKNSKPVLILRHFQHVHWYRQHSDFSTCSIIITHYTASNIQTGHNIKSSWYRMWNIMCTGPDLHTPTLAGAGLHAGPRVHTPSSGA